MTDVILDTNFVLTCIRNKLDFYDELETRGYSVLIPFEVVEEIKRLRDSNKKLKFKDEADLALRLIESGDHRKVHCPGRYVDVGLKAYLKEHPKVILATLDKNLKRIVNNRKMIIRNRKKLELQ